MSRHAKSLSESGRGNFWKGRRRVTIGFQPAEYEAVRASAGAAGMTIAALVRTALCEATPSALVEHRRSEQALRASLAAAQAEVRRLRRETARLTRLAQPEIRLLPGRVDPDLAALLDVAAGWGESAAELHMALAERVRDPGKKSEYLAGAGHVLAVAESLRTYASRAVR